MKKKITKAMQKEIDTFEASLAKEKASMTAKKFNKLLKPSKTLTLAKIIKIVKDVRKKLKKLKNN
jgi:hypothetical protein